MISLVMTIYNEEKNIHNTLISIALQTRMPDEFIIVDGGSTDGTANVIAGFIAKNPLGRRIKFVVEKRASSIASNAPIAVGRNVAIELAVGDIIAVIDGGCTAEPQWLERIVEPIESGAADMVAGGYVIIPRSAVERLFAIQQTPIAKDGNFSPSSRSVAFTKGIWAKVGGYPAGAKYGEDTAFNFLVLGTGARLVSRNDARVVWEPDGTDSLAGVAALLGKYAFGDGLRGIGAKKYVRKMLYYSVAVFMGIASLLVDGFGVVVATSSFVVLVVLLFIRYAVQCHSRAAGCGFQASASMTFAYVAFSIFTDIVRIAAFAAGISRHRVGAGRS